MNKYCITCKFKRKRSILLPLHTHTIAYFRNTNTLHRAEFSSILTQSLSSLNGPISYQCPTNLYQIWDDSSSTMQDSPLTIHPVPSIPSIPSIHPPIHSPSPNLPATNKPKATKSPYQLTKFVYVEGLVHNLTSYQPFKIPATIPSHCRQTKPNQTIQLFFYS
jgi:hypothetical protein